jgi:uncharacterized RDD family membrane protein YckC
VSGQDYAEWFYAIGAAQHGPVEARTILHLLSSGQLSWDSLVWREGMPQWSRVGDVPQLTGAPGAAGTAGAPMLGYNVPLDYHTHVAPAYAGFWIRFAAAILDGLIVTLPLWLIFAAIRSAAGVPVFEESTSDEALIIDVIDGVSGLIIHWLYEALLTSSHRQATFGKLAVGVKVTDVYGQPISFGRATGRHFAKILSGIILLIGYMMAGWTQKKQALHDMIAGTVVVYR